MLRTRPILVFVIKLVVIFGLLVAPFSFYDDIYGKFYRFCASTVFKKVRGTGFAMFSPGSDKQFTHINVGNYAQVDANGQTDTASIEFNTRYRGFLPTILILTLVLASPVSIRRKIVALVLGFFLVTCIVMLKQWIHILHLNLEHPWLKLYDFSEGNKKVIEYLYQSFAISVSPSLVFTVVIWLLITFRKDDLKIFKPQAATESSGHWLFGKRSKLKDKSKMQPGKRNI